MIPTRNPAISPTDGAFAYHHHGGADPRFMSEQQRNVGTLTGDDTAGPPQAQGCPVWTAVR